MSSLITHDMSLVADIRRRTAAANRNNVSRTAAYLAFYREHPEVHWALLAHLVSRNGGWSMTDLRGEWLPRLMDEQDIRAFFWFLERSNWLIFHDAYAQLLLFAEMKRTGTDLTPLLPRLGVSRFMQPVWREFLAEQDSVRLTRALIVNEQQYIEQRVVRKPFAREQVFANLAFLAQSVLSLNQVLFPYKAHPADRRLSVVGIAVHNFPSVRQRISVGKTLYRLLFADARGTKRLSGGRPAFRIRDRAPITGPTCFRPNLTEKPRKTSTGRASTAPTCSRAAPSCTALR